MEKKIILKAENGLHARPAGAIVKLASEFQSEITINDINAKSIMSLMGSGFEKGEELIIKAEGIDAEKAIEDIASLIENLD